MKLHFFVSEQVTALKSSKYTGLSSKKIYSTDKNNKQSVIYYKKTDSLQTHIFSDKIALVNVDKPFAKAMHQFLCSSNSKIILTRFLKEEF